MIQLNNKKITILFYGVERLISASIGRASTCYTVRRKTNRKEKKEDILAMKAAGG
jgi:hypothetical protein